MRTLWRILVLMTFPIWMPITILITVLYGAWCIIELMADDTYEQLFK